MDKNLNKTQIIIKEILKGKEIILNFPIGCGKSTFTKILVEELLKDIYRKQDKTFGVNNYERKKIKKIHI